MALYPDYAPKKKKFRFFDAPEMETEPPVEDSPAEETEEPSVGSEPRYCLRCEGTEMKFFRKLKLQLEGYYGPGSVLNLFEDEDDPDSLSLLPLKMYVCPQCRRTELVWALDVMPGGEEIPLTGVARYERIYKNSPMQRLRQIIEGKEYDEDMKQAAQNILSRRLSGED